YINTVINQEWELMRDGEMSTKAQSLLENMYSILENYIPKGNNERIFYQQVLDSYNGALRARDHRINASNSIIPDSFFAIIVLNLLLLIIAICLVEEQFKKPEVIFLILVSIMVGTNLSLTMILDYPFSGEFSISSKPFTQGILGPLYQGSF
ncbi:MAG: DUF4239 domain-containing protein, partial [Gammaproteobacteria bacterium]